ncbi:replication initiation and membrane attachment family protein [Cytobacillus spongiae]|uniref:replication initiation and membrane attachment family protein n=1 Tax=Cytobacillus spongiae TaxID=2901381 RepID=UPI001F41932A|nr:replication initiation and membrane attachment family protein [Cytobacillus spongiae]UII55137.1 replication initiation and membrane attachment family protein [Cytobacillus spongiae]
MAQYWQEMVPVDRYKVASNGLIHEYDRKILTYLYQPLIGSSCFSLYMTLWGELEDNRLWSESNSHHSIMSIMDMNMKEIYEARLKLEGIGLLKTYTHKEEDARSFIYELQPPLTPEQFFLDGMLNIYLYRKVGKNQFLRLKRFFSDAILDRNDEFQDVTRSFQEVFMSATPTHLSSNKEMKEDLGGLSGQRFVGRAETKEIKIISTDFNFDLLLAGLKESLIPKDALTDKVREAISKLAFLYTIDPIQMKNILLSAVTPDNSIDIEELRKAARDWFQLEHNDQLPSLTDRVQPQLYVSQSEGPPQTKEEELVHYLEKTSPRQLLVDISGGSEPSKSDLQIIEEVMFQQKLLPGVINVLIQYVMLKTDMKLTKGYVEKIASHWARKKITHVKEAMELAKREHRQYLDWAEGKNSPKPRVSNRKKPVRTEQLPDWFNEQETVKTDQGSTADLEAKKKELEERLKKYRN